MPRALPRSATRPDWTWIRVEWEADLKSDREIAAQSTAAGRKVSHNAIGKRARTEGWKKKAVAQQVRAAVNRQLLDAGVVPTDSAVPNDVPTEQVIEIAARQGVEVIREHRQSIKRTKDLAHKLLTQLEEATEQAEQLMAQAQDSEARSRAALMRAVGLPSRVATAKDLVQILHRAIGLERQAFNLDETAEDDSIESRLAKLEQE